MFDKKFQQRTPKILSDEQDDTKDSQQNPAILIKSLDNTYRSNEQLVIPGTTMTPNNAKENKIPNISSKDFQLDISKNKQKMSPNQKSSAKSLLKDQYVPPIKKGSA